MNRDEPRGSCGKKALHRQLSAVGGKKAPSGSTMFNWVQSFKNGDETAQASVHGWDRNTVK